MNNPNKAKSLKTLNDPIHGFISIEDQLIFTLIEHPHFQRLRRISQLGLTNLVYGGANHSRFQHALGAMHLMKQAIQVLRNKGVSISDEEEQASKAAILLHDIGHGPYSHALENTLVKGINHEQISLQVMLDLNEELDGALEMAIKIYRDEYPVKFLHQLVSSQLDTDRLDYLKRDSFFTGVSEGVIGSERIIKMLTVHNGQIAVEAKGIYSLEKFLIARRLMYWQVYLHKTVLSAEFLLMKILERAQELAHRGDMITSSPSLGFFISAKAPFSAEDHSEWMPLFLELDDTDVLHAIKQWQNHEDPVLSELCQRLIQRRLLKVKSIPEPLSESEMKDLLNETAKGMGWSPEDSGYICFQERLLNIAYSTEEERINILYKDGTVKDISQAASIFRFASLEAQESKQYLYHPGFLDV